MTSVHTDILIIGSGISGLMVAIKCAQTFPDAAITILTKATDQSETNTRYAQGGVAAVWDAQSDSTAQHIEDTLTTGDGLCDSAIVQLVVEQGPDRLRELLDWDIRLDKTGQDYALGREGGHSANRILHYKDMTGWELMRGLSLKAQSLPNITIRADHLALDLITQHHLKSPATTPLTCYGAYVLEPSTGEIHTYSSRVTILSTGGVGQVYQSTTNPMIATGDGIAMAYRAKATIVDMEFVQFHPTALYTAEHTDAQAFLISEAVRGEGAELKTPAGKPFMHRYDPRGSLAPRDIVARAIDAEMKRTGKPHMSLDCRMIPDNQFQSHFPTIWEQCQSRHIHPARQMIPIVPAAHYICGGIAVDTNSRSSIQQLYAIGECARTGLHGANRLASNSLLECMVFADRAHRDITRTLPTIGDTPPIPPWDARGTSEPEEMVLITAARKELQTTMSEYMGIVRTNIRLERAKQRLRQLYEESDTLYRTTSLSPQLIELRNLITIGHLINRAARHRHENKGLHFNLDDASD